MKARLLILVMLFVCFTCGTNNKPVSDTQKEKIKGEVKEVITTIIKGAEEANPDIILESYLDSPDFVFVYNGKTYTYKEIANNIKSDYNTQINQKCTIADEKFAVLDNTTVLVTTNCTWVFNFKDGHSTLLDPLVVQLLFRKINDRWKVINCVESGVAQRIMNNETSKQLNQVELMKQFLGSWKCDVTKDTTAFWDANSYGTGLENWYKYVKDGKIVDEGKQLWGYDKTIDKFYATTLQKGRDINIDVYYFISTNKCRMYTLYDIENPEKAPVRWEIEFKSPDMFIETYISNNEPFKSRTFTRMR